jgi:hypothetical protein
VLFRPKFFELRYSGAIGKDVRCVRPVVKFPQVRVVLGYSVSTRGNGVDEPRWPEDLEMEIVMKEEVSTPSFGGLLVGVAAASCHMVL